MPTSDGARPSAADAGRVEPDGVDDGEHDQRGWARSGAMALTGEPGGPVWDARGPLADRLTAAANDVMMLARRRGVDLVLDGPALLGERAALTGLGRRGSTAVGGSCQMVEIADGWIALNLARPSDVELLAVLVAQVAARGPGRHLDPNRWPETAARLGAMTGADIEERAVDLGLPLAVVPAVLPGGGQAGPGPQLSRLAAAGAGAGAALGPGAGAEPAGGSPTVVELASLWAGPLCGDLLSRSGCRVIKVETVQRPDGARRGSGPFFDLLNGAKQSVLIDLMAPGDRRLLDALLDAADVVIDGSRRRVMEQWGIDVEGPDGAVAAGTVWVSITGHGRTGIGARRVAFGDDAAVAGGLVVTPGAPTAGGLEEPLFVADAAADPIAGLLAARETLIMLDNNEPGVGALVDVSLVGAAAHAAAGVEWVATDVADAAPPRARAGERPAAHLGADTDSVRAEFAG